MYDHQQAPRYLKLTYRVSNICYIISLETYITDKKLFDRSLLGSPKLRLFDQKYIKNSNIVKNYYNCFLAYDILNCNSFLWYKAEFLAAITPVFSVTWSFGNHSNMANWCLRKIYC